MDKQQLFQQITECPVCYLTFTEPKVLPCDHLLCKSCTDHIKKGSSIKCPVCNKLSPASKIKADFRLQQFLDLLKQTEMTSSDKQQQAQGESVTVLKYQFCVLLYVLSVLSFFIRSYWLNVELSSL